MSNLKGAAMIEAIRELRPNSAWYVVGEEQCFDDLVWDESNETDAPSYEEVLAKTEEIRANRLATAYQRKRKKEYDKLNQYDLMYQDKVNGTNKWGEAIEAIKAKYPKPTEESDA